MHSMDFMVANLAVMPLGQIYHSLPGEHHLSRLHSIPSIPALYIYYVHSWWCDLIEWSRWVWKSIYRIWVWSNAFVHHTIGSDFHVHNLSAHTQINATSTVFLLLDAFRISAAGQLRYAFIFVQLLLNASQPIQHLILIFIPFFAHNPRGHISFSIRSSCARSNLFTYWAK